MMQLVKLGGRIMVNVMNVVYVYLKSVYWKKPFTFKHLDPVII